MGIEGTYLNIIKVTYNKPIANITFNGEKQSIPSTIRNKTRVPTLGSPSYSNQHLACFHILTVVNSSVNTRVHVSF